MIRWIPLAAVVALGCNVDPVNINAHGVDLDSGAPPPADAGGADAAAVEAGEAGPPPPACPSVALTTESDYTSTNVSVIGHDGKVLSSSFISSASATTGTSAPLSGDVVLPHDSPSSSVVVIDRANAVITWIDLSSAKVTSQLSVATGFASDPYDYLDVGPTKAYVTRYATNPNPGLQLFDSGSDILVVDPTTHSVTFRIDLSSQVTGSFLPRPDRLTRVGPDAVITLDRFDANFASAEDARLLGVDIATDTIAWKLDLTGFANCEAMTRSPSGKLLALGCAGVYSDGTAGQLARSGIVLLDVTQRPPVIANSWHATTTLMAALGLWNSLAFFSETKLLGVTNGDFSAGTNDSAFTFDTTTGTATPLVTSSTPFVFGDVSCVPGCGDVCFLADASKNVLQRWSIQAQSLMAGPDVSPDPTPGLPPRTLGAF